jgi:serine/threonine protein kinase
MSEPGGPEHGGVGPGKEPSDPPAPPAVERIGKYEILGLLGKGGMGAVYRAFDPFLEREVALKAMLPQIAEVPEHKQRFEREARAVARLTHPNVVTVFDLGYHTDGTPYIVMELLQGRDLSTGSVATLEQKVSIVLQVLEGLGQAHKAGIVHRDIKPANVFITRDGTAKIMDFGIARLGPSAATGTGAVLGTASYMSPEQVKAQPLDGRSDLFSVGSMLCELLTGVKPFDAESAIVTMYRIAHDEPEIDLPGSPEYERFGPVLRKALAKDPNDRYATSAEFAEALSKCLGEAPSKPPVQAKAPDEGAGSPRTGPAAATSAAPGAPAPRTKPPGRPFDQRELFRILRDVYVGGKSGHLHFTSSQGHRSLRIGKGRITHAISDRDGEHLGEVLVRYGVITQGDLERALDTEKRLGPVLSGMGLLDRNGLGEALGLHVREIVFAMLEEEEGTLSFEELFDTASEADVVSNLSTGQVILEATRRVLDPGLVRRVLGDMDRVLVLSSDPVLRSQSITLTPTDGFVLSRVDGTLSARDVISLSPVPPEDTEQSLFSLLCTGIVDYKEKTTAATSRRRSPPAPATGRSPGAAPPAGTPAAADARPDSNPLPPKASAPPSPPGALGGPAATPPEPLPAETKPSRPPPAVPARSAPVLDQDFHAPDPASQVREAEAHFAEQRYGDAIQLVEPLIPHLAGALRTRAAILLAQACIKSNRPDVGAESALLGLLGEDPKCTPAYFTLGALYRSRNDLERARTMYRKVLELSPEHRGAAAELARLGDG